MRPESPTDVPRPETLQAALRRAADFPNTGLRFLDRREQPTWYPWSAIHDRAAATAAGLLARGLTPGERVAVIFPTSIEFFDAFFGTLLAGGCPVPLYPPVRLGRLDEYHHRTAAMVTACGARLVLADKRIRRLLGETMARAQDPEADRTVHCLTLDDLPSERPGTPVPVSPDDLGLVQFSSGTTGDPSPVALTHRALQAQSAAIETFLVDADNVTHAGVSWLPLYHDMGLVGCVLPALNRPGVLTLLGPELFVARPAAWLRALSRWGGTVSPAPNFAYGLCLDRIRDEELEGVDLSAWRLALNGAEPVAPGVLRAFQERFARWGLRPEALNPVYGLSEAALAVTFSDVSQPFAAFRFNREALARGVAVIDPAGLELVAVGRPVPGFEIRIVDDEGGEQPTGHVGRVRVRGPSLMQGYLDRPDQTAQVLRNGWLDTGDLGFWHEGQVVLTGRAKDVLVLRGRKHAPHLVEQAVDGVVGVRTGCAAAVTHLPEGGDRELLLLLVEHCKEATTVQLDAVPDGCRKAVLSATGLACDEVVILPPGTLPRTSSGKIRRQESLHRYRAGALRAPEPVNLWRVARSMGRSSVAFARTRLAHWRRSQTAHGE